MNIYLLVLLRLVHVVAGTLWVGAAVFYLFFVQPSVKAIGPAGPQFMQSLEDRRKYPLFMVSVSLLTVLAGFVLFLNTSGGFNLAWLNSGTGMGYTLGALAAFVAFFVGLFVIGPTSGRMGEVGSQIASSGKAPTPIQFNLLQALEKKLALAERIDFIMLVIALLAMATARYWIF